MKIDFSKIGRLFTVGRSNVKMRDCGTVALDAEEQLTFVTESGNEYDVARKSWGFYATPSLNWRLRNFNFRPVMVKNLEQRYFLLLVETGKEHDFNRYIAEESLKVVCWLDTDEALQKLGT